MAGTQKINSPEQVVGTREVLTSNRTYYVRTDGSDSNTGLTNTAGGAFLTLQHAYDVISSLDFNGKDITVQVADGTYSAGCSIASAWVGGGTLTIQGNNGTPANVLVSITSGNCLSVSCVLPGTVTIKDMEMRTATAAYPDGICIKHTGAGTVQYSNIRFGSCNSCHILSGAPGALVYCTGNYAITGSCTNVGVGCHFFTTRGGAIEYDNVTITVSASLTFGRAFAFVEVSGIIYTFPVSTFSTNVATGKRYEVSMNGVCNVVGAGASYFPGNVAGTTATGGQYA